MASQFRKRAANFKSIARGVWRKYAAYLAAGVCSLLLLVYLISPDECRGKWHTQMLCDQYKQGVITGDLCYGLCSQQSVYLSSCGHDANGNLVFYQNGTTAIKTRDRFFPHKDAQKNDLGHVYVQPEAGSSMDHFREMVGQYLKLKLGDSDHSALLQDLLNTADVNKDDTVSLAEAKTLWALLKHNEFLLLQVLKTNYHTSTFHSFCGEAYLVHDLPSTKHLYHRPRPGSLSHWLFPGSYLWGLPPWVVRGKIAVGLLDFTLDVYQHHNHGSFYFCGLNESNVGYTDRSDVVMQDLSLVLPRNVVKHFLENVQCSSNDGCHFTKHCSTICDLSSKQCTDDLVQPNLALVCSILKPYILPDIPRRIRADFLNFIAHCIDLQTKGQDFEIQHSLILNDLKSLLWRQISAQV